MASLAAPKAKKLSKKEREELDRQEKKRLKREEKEKEEAERAQERKHREEKEKERQEREEREWKRQEQEEKERHARHEEKERQRAEEKERQRAEEKERQRAEEKERRAEEKERQRAEEKERQRAEEKERQKQEEKERRHEEKERLRHEEKERLRHEEKERQRQEEKDRQKHGDKDRQRHEDNMDHSWETSDRGHHGADEEEANSHHHHNRHNEDHEPEINDKRKKELATRAVEAFKVSPDPEVAHNRERDNVYPTPSVDTVPISPPTPPAEKKPASLGIIFPAVEFAQSPQPMEEGEYTRAPGGYSWESYIQETTKTTEARIKSNEENTAMLVALPLSPPEYPEKDNANTQAKTADCLIARADHQAMEEGGFRESAKFPQPGYHDPWADAWTDSVPVSGGSIAYPSWRGPPTVYAVEGKPPAALAVDAARPNDDVAVSPIAAFGAGALMLEESEAESEGEQSKPLAPPKNASGSGGSSPARVVGLRELWKLNKEAKKRKTVRSTGAGGASRSRSGDPDGDDEEYSEAEDPEFGTHDLQFRLESDDEDRHRAEPGDEGMYG